MAEIRIRTDNGHQARTIREASAQAAFLADHHIGFAQWPIDRLNASDLDAASDTQAYILSTFAPEIERLKREQGYRTADVIGLRPDTENLDGILAKFDKEHRHSEDEVRFVVDGRGVFTIHSDLDDSVFDVEVQPGDLLMVPEGTWHWFSLCEDRRITCIRLFTEQTGWVANYRG
jgi:1,2-dihydroxy-3-keto-5-methylthiopentene dioxygenase